MSLHEQLNDFLEKSNTSVTELNATIKGFNGLISQAIIEAPDEHKPQLQKLKNDCMQTINLAQSGNIEKANELLNKLKDEYKNP